MARFVLRPAKIREDKFALVRDAEPVVLPSFQDLIRFFGRDPRQTDSQGLRTLRSIEISGFVGVLKTDDGRSRIFHVWNRGRGNSIKWLLKKIPNFPSLVDRLYYVHEVLWEDGKTEELGVSKERTA